MLTKFCHTVSQTVSEYGNGDDFTYISYVGQPLIVSRRDKAD